MNKIFDKLAKNIKNHTPDLKAFQSRFKPEANQKTKNTGEIKGKIVIQNHQKPQILNHIEKLVFQDMYTPIKPEVKNACEIVHFALNNDTPVDTQYIYLLLPNITLQYNQNTKEEYNEYLKYRHNVHDHQERRLEVEDVYGMRDSNTEGSRGRLTPDKWKNNPNNNN